MEVIETSVNQSNHKKLLISWSIILCRNVTIGEMKTSICVDTWKHIFKDLSMIKSSMISYDRRLSDRLFLKSGPLFDPFPHVLLKNNRLWAKSDVFVGGLHLFHKTETFELVRFCHKFVQLFLLQLTSSSQSWRPKEIWNIDSNAEI